MKQMDGLDHPRNRQAVHRRSLFRANEDKIVIRQRICLQVKDAIVFRAPLDVHRLSREWTTCKVSIAAFMDRSEEHTSELQSHLNLVCRLLLEKKKNRKSEMTIIQNTYA